MLIVRRLADGPMRFNELKRIGAISQRMRTLTLTLRGLECDGRVSRTIYPTLPPAVGYDLTGLGHSLREPSKASGHWAFQHLGVIEHARRACRSKGIGSLHDARTASVRDVAQGRQDRSTGAARLRGRVAGSTLQTKRGRVARRPADLINLMKKS